MNNFQKKMNHQRTALLETILNSNMDELTDKIKSAQEIFDLQKCDYDSARSNWLITRRYLNESKGTDNYSKYLAKNKEVSRTYNLHRKTLYSVYIYLSTLNSIKSDILNHKLSFNPRNSILITPSMAVDLIKTAMTVVRTGQPTSYEWIDTAQPIPTEK